MKRKVIFFLASNSFYISPFRINRPMIKYIIITSLLLVMLAQQSNDTQITELIIDGKITAKIYPSMKYALRLDDNCTAVNNNTNKRLELTLNQNCTASKVRIYIQIPLAVIQASNESSVSGNPIWKRDSKINMTFGSASVGNFINIKAQKIVVSLENASSLSLSGNGSSIIGNLHNKSKLNIKGAYDHYNITCDQSSQIQQKQ